MLVFSQFFSFLVHLCPSWPSDVQVEVFPGKWNYDSGHGPMCVCIYIYIYIALPLRLGDRLIVRKAPSEGAVDGGVVNFFCFMHPSCDQIDQGRL